MGVETLIMAIGAGAAVGGQVKSLQNQKESAKLQSQQSALQNHRSQVSALRELQMKRAAALSSGATQGALDSSPLAAGLSGLDSQMGSGLGYASQQSGLSQKISQKESAAKTWDAISQLGGMAYQYGQNMK